MPALDTLWPYLLILITLFFTGIGLPPLPEEVPIIAAAIHASNSELVWWLAWPACIVGIVAADLVLYWLGRLGGNRLLQSRWVQRILPPARHERLVDGFHRHGVKILLTGRLLPGLRTGVFLTAGAMRYPFLRFLVADSLYAIPGVGVVFFGSYFLTETFSRLLAEVDHVRHWLLALVLLAACGYGLFRYYRFRKQRVEANDFSPPSIPDLLVDEGKSTEPAEPLNPVVKPPSSPGDHVKACSPP